MLSRGGLLVVLGAFALGAPGSAAAKGPNVARVCGASGCTTLRGESAVQPLISWWYTPFSSRRAPRPAPYYSIAIRDPSGVRWSLLYVPSRRAMRIWQNRVPPYNQPIGPYWRDVPAAAVSGLGRVAAGLKPYAAPSAWRR